ncbi:recombinase family protein [Propionibacterium freudenreichii]
MMLWGYARVSTADQDAALQVDALRAAGVDEAHVVVDRCSGARAERPGLDDVMARIEAGDTLIVWKLDRLGRSLPHLVGLLNLLGERGAGFRSLTESGMDTSTAQGRLLFGIMGSLAEFERDLIRERTMAGLEAARRKGHHGGRPSSVSPQQAETLRLYVSQGSSITTAAKGAGVSRFAASRYLSGKTKSVKPPENPSLLGDM